MGAQLSVKPFVIRDCALASIATGRRAQNLRELCDQLAEVDLSSIYFHFWGCLLRPRFDDPEYNNDIAAWVGHSLREFALAEQLAVIDPAEFTDLGELRQELLDAIEAHLDTTEFLTWSRRQDQFHFRRAQIVVFDTGRQVTAPAEFAGLMPALSLGSVFYHFIDGRRRPPQLLDDFRVWLGQFGDRHEDLIQRLAGVDPYFTTLAELRATLAEVFRSHFAGAAG